MAGRKKETEVELPLEQALLQLETLVESMESGELTLDQALAAFEQGIKLTRQCQQTLADAEQKVQMLLEQNGSLVPAADDSDNADDIPF